ncbi:acylneuraminate cytidylyltransferase family protein [Chryseobacterium tongliaoense]|uniref:acylneuraminate cytidylyltransferase family protein n=1 Tax=Chryseobacterium tongliaoense TaxID=3240933 RepID=UPI003510F1A5
MIALIPARGGSKGLPGKNLKILKGKPLIAYTIEAALKVKGITKVIVSTDDHQIAETAKKYGAIVPFMRPDFLATDTATSKDVIIYTLKKLLENKESIESFILLQPTSPLRDDQDILSAIEFFDSNGADAVISYCEEYHPLRWHKYINDKGNLEDIFEKAGEQRQAERKSYFPNGAIYIYDTEKYLTDSIKSQNTYAFVMPRNKSIDIDTIDDFEYCEYLIERNELYKKIK